VDSPAQRYAAARRRGDHPVTAEFAAGYPFALDPFQEQACAAVEEGRGVLVAAPTGAGKTVVGEFAVHLALRRGAKCFYTTPIKALSNQKYADLVTRHGPAAVGLLTGDNSVNGDAPVVVMTTEVLRNMLYAGSPTLAGLSYVVMDEVHYLADRFRGAVWEEVIIHLPESVTLVSLSATVSNAEEFADWLVTVRGDTQVVVEERRPVPLWQHMLVGRRLFDLFALPAVAPPAGGAEAAQVDPELVRYARDQLRPAEVGRPGRPLRLRWRPPSRPTVIERLDREGLLPAITFVFSRAGCDAAVRQCLRAGLRLTTTEERSEIRAVAAAHTAALAPADLDALGYGEWLAGLEYGLAAHHAGLLPAFKEAVEELFVRGLVRAVFATETLALGINMPARSVVLERLTKWNGQAQVGLTPGEYTQLTGRAGRRGIDVEGHAVVLWSPETDPRQVAGLASTRTYPLVSSFRPTYNMAVNLVGQLGREAARTLLESSFAQFQADRAVVGLARQVQRNLTALADAVAAAHCERGDFAEYDRLSEALRAAEAERARGRAAARRAAAAAALERLRVGDVIRVPGGRRAGLAVVLDPGRQDLGEPRPLVLTEHRWAGRLSTVDFPAAVQPVGQLRVPRHFNHRSPQARRDLAASLRNLAVEPGGRRPADAPDDAVLADLAARLRTHPCHGCPDRERHSRAAGRHRRLRAETAALERRVQRRTSSLARTFDQVCAVLGELGYLTGDQVHPAGRLLARIWSESDLLVAECLRRGVWARLAPAELAAAVSTVVYEPRRPVEQGPPRLPTAAVARAVEQTARLWAELADLEDRTGLPAARAPDPGFAWAAFRWARGDQLAAVLAPPGPARWADASDAGETRSAGDFVRWCRQLLDLLDQIAGAVDPADPLAGAARAAGAAVRRGVVAVSMVG